MTTFLASSRMPRRSSLIRQLPLIALAAALIIYALMTPSFFSWSNMSAIMSSIGPVGLVGVGMTVIMISGALFSLSLGISATVASMLFLWALQYGVVESIGLTVVVSALYCAIQGFLVGAIGANPIIVTLAAGTLLAGITASVSGGSGVTPPLGVDLDFLSARPLGIPMAVWCLAGATVVLELLMRRTTTGWRVYLLGDNPSAARLAGLRVMKLYVLVFAIAGAAAALAGILVAGITHSANLTANPTLTFDAIAAALVGGTAVTGGRGSVSRTVLGAVAIAVLSDLVVLNGYSTGFQILIKGSLVLSVVLVSGFGSRGE